MKKKTLRGLLLSCLLFISYPVFAKTTLTFLIAGVTGAPLKNINQRLAIDAADAGILTPAVMQSLYQKGPENIQKAVEPYGYFRATVKSLGLTHVGKKWTAAYSVNLGQPLRITALNINLTGPGRDKPYILKALRVIPLHVGDIFNVPNYENARDRLLFAAQNDGYIMARMSTDKILIDLTKYTCVINMTMDTLPRYYFGETTFSPNPLSDKFLKRFLNYTTNNPFSAKKLIHLQNNLSTPGYFKSVNVVPDIEHAQNYHVPVHVDLVPNKRKVYQFGLGYGTVTGPRITAGVTWRWVNRYGHQFNTSVSWSTVQKNIQAQYLIPTKGDPAHSQYAINAGYFTLKPRHGDSTVKKFGVGYITTHGRWQRNFNLSYQFEDYRIDPDRKYRSARVLLPNVSFNWTSTNDPINVKNGARVYFMLQGAHKDLASTVTFAQAEARAKTVNTFFDDNRIILRGDVGYTVIQNAVKLPLSLRFYAGGPSSVRGYSIDSMGPGRYLTVASAEYQRRIYGNWYGAVFYDAGNAFDVFSKYFKDLNRSTGLGAVWQSPIGSISFYIAKALTAKGQPLRFEFNLGPQL